VIIPKDNEKDLAEVPDNVKTGLKIVPVASMGEVLDVALTRKPEAIDWVEPDVPATSLPITDGEGDQVVTH
jgi:ATP-dependent Lon protease